jgi:GNAT superfamily N-acetyltransferase
MSLDRSPISVRQAVAADLAALAGLFDSYRQFQGKPSDLGAGADFLRDRLDHGESVLFIAIDGTEPAGFAQLYPSFSSVSLARVFVLNDLFVLPARRKRGVASSLLAAAQSYAWAMGAARLSLNVARDNQAAQAVYDRKGWVRDAEFFMYHRYPAQR